MVRNDKSTISAMTRGGLLGSASGKEGRETNNIVLNNINVNKIWEIKLLILLICTAIYKVN